MSPRPHRTPQQAGVWHPAGLGYELADEFVAGLDQIAGYPGAWPTFTDDVRRYRLARFPYGVLYSVVDGTVLIVGVMHLAMDPTPWVERVKK